MRLHALPIALALAAISSSALKIPFRQAKRSPVQRRSGAAGVSVSRPGAGLANTNVLAAASGGSNDNTNAFDVNSVHDLIYIANITLGGNEYPVQLDTGSSDLWVEGPSTPLPNSNQTSTIQNLTYGIGWANGHISYAPVEFAGISVPSQAFLDVSSAQNPALSYGADGILGLGFTSLSTIDAIVNRTNSSTGRSLLYNLFMDNPKESNFIAFSLQRSSDSSDSADGLFSVGEYDPQYADVANTNPISTFPQSSPTRWTILIDSLIVGQNQISVTTDVSGAPGNQAVALLDSGTSYTYAPTDICNAIYGGVQGAHYDADQGQWIVPCDAEIDMALQINNQIYPLHPLDVSPQSLSDPSTCLGSFVPQAVAVGQGEFDWLIGDNFLRSVYAIYDFGDFGSSGHMGDPYLKLLSIIDPNKASADFHSLRGGTPLTNITYNASNSTAGSTTVSVSDDVAKVLAKIGMFFPAMLAVMAFNALILLVLVIVGIVFLCKNRGPKTSRKTRGRMSPVPLNRTSRFSSTGESTHAYQPVSMALTEDTFVPPMPAFRGDTMRKNKAKSSFSSSISMPFPASPVDEPFTPPSPSFGREGRSGDRPQSSFLPSPIRPQSFMPLANRPQSSYTPTSNSASQHSALIAALDTGEIQSQDDTGRSSPPETKVFPEGSPFESPSTSPGSGVQLVDRPRSVASSTGPPEPDPLAPPSPTFRSNVQPGDRPRSYASPADSLEQNPLVPPSPTFRKNLQPGDRPRSYTPSAVSVEQNPLAPSSPSFGRNLQPGDRPRSYAPSAVSVEPNPLVPPSPTSRGGIQLSDRPSSFAPPSVSAEQNPLTAPSSAFRGSVQLTDRPRSSVHQAVSPEQNPLTAASSAFRGSVQLTDRPRSSMPRAVSPEQNPLTAPSPTFRGGVQLTDRPMSSVPPAVSPERNPLTPPSPTFMRSIQPGDRPRSFVPPEVSSDQTLSVPPSPPFRSRDRRSFTPTAGSPHQTLFAPPSPSFKSNVQAGDRPRSYAPSAVSPEDELFTPPSAPFRGGDRPRSMA